ncbi:fumarate/nitrate reduction transcriptional regulator Fnr [Bermanella sp. R86510]|uniref:fumarate/nitrate reduction transcriptional regulator Fnr n=1 Tax=unclassified Bermanella TaxID=2627862 RepID=UPI0037C9F5CE
MADKNIISLAKSGAGQPHCSTCSLSSLCLPIALDNKDLDALDRIIKRGRPLQKGETLFKQGDAFKAVYAIRTGAIKTYTVAPSGEEQITGFHLASEIVGLSGYSEETYPLTAKALETTTVCELPLERLEVLCDEIPGLRKQMMRNMSGEIRQDQQMMLQLSKKSADERLAYFLLDLSSRFERRGFSPKTFRLSMSRVDISNYLGLAVETVSRIFTRMQKSELISTEGKEVTLLDISGLNKLAGNPDVKEACEHIRNT